MSRVFANTMSSTKVGSDQGELLDVKSPVTSNVRSLTPKGSLYSQISTAVVEKADQTKKSVVASFYEGMSAMLHGETRGIERVPEEEKTQTDFWGCATMWVSANLTVSGFSLGAISYTAFGLDYGTSILVIFFFSLLGALRTAFFSIFGSKFGLRQMIISRYLIGNVGMRIFALCNTIACVGWSSCNLMPSAQLLHIINGGVLPPWAGCLVLIILTIFVSFFGYHLIHNLRNGHGSQQSLFWCLFLFALPRPTFSNLVLRMLTVLGPLGARPIRHTLVTFCRLVALSLVLPLVGQLMLLATLAT